jgi:SET domain-containing protein
MYKPLPNSVTIKPSKIDGLGLFAIKVIPKNTYFGLTHIAVGNHLIRTPLGGFINHSQKPNCKKIVFEDETHLKAIRKIKKGEELTLKYTLYDPRGSNE